MRVRARVREAPPHQPPRAVFTQSDEPGGGGGGGGGEMAVVVMAVAMAARDCD